MRSTTELVKQNVWVRRKTTRMGGGVSRALEVLVRALEHLGCEPVLRGHRGMARCPAHQDRDPSLSIGSGATGRVLVHCHAGCSVEAVLEAMGGDWRMLFASDDPWPGRDGSFDDQSAMRYRPDFLPLDILQEEIELRGGGRRRPLDPDTPTIRAPRL